jgi:hypothetical protein
MKKETEQQEDIRNGSPQIIVLPNAFVLVGYFHRCGDLVTIKNSFIIRRYGTKKGLGEIALNGPTKETVLDFLGTGQCEATTIIFTIVCDVFKWRKTFANNESQPT